MKQLKFMLAAATAIGLATAAQAGTNYTGFPENFDSATAGDAATTLTGYEFNGADGDDESVVQAGGYDGSANALKVNTGTEPLLRAIDYSTAANAVELDKSKAEEKINSLDIDTMVQFTVTPELDTVMPGLINPELKDEDGNLVLEDNIKDDKLLIYLQEKTVGETKSNVLKVWASLYTPAQSGRVEIPATFKPQEVTIANEITVQPNTWYRLQVSTKIDSDGVVYFEIMLDGTKLYTETSLYSSGGDKFPSLLGNKSTTLTYVGFAGEGLVDDLVVSRELDAPSSVDFTFTLGENVSAVSWTVGGVEQGDLTYSAPAGSTYDVVIKSVTYAPGYAGSKDWAGWTSTVTASTKVVIDGAEKFADVSEDGVVTPTKDTVAAVNAGPFMVPEATDDNAAAVAAAKAELGKALTWATSAAKGGKSYAAAIEAITAMDFADKTETATEQAYLLNCAPTEDAIKEKKDAFVFSAVTFDENGDPVVTVDPEFAGDVNGRIEIRGATSLDAEDAFTAPQKDGDAFFKAFLVK